MNNAQLIMTFIGTVGILAIYWTLWKTRNELIEGREKLTSTLSEIRKLLESKAGKG